MRRYDAVIFDLYGTLIDIHTDETRPALWGKMADFYARNGAGFTPVELQKEYRRLADHLLTEAGGLWPEIDLTDVFAALFSSAGAAPEPETVSTAAQLFRRYSTTHLRAYAGAAEILTKLRQDGHRVLLLSNAQRCFTVPELDTLELSGCFDGIYLSSDYGFQKPDPRFFEALLFSEGLRPDQCLMVGNDPVCDAAGARRAGMDVWYVHSGLTPEDAPSLSEVDADYRQAGTDLRALGRALLSPDH